MRVAAQRSARGGGGWPCTSRCASLTTHSIHKPLCNSSRSTMAVVLASSSAALRVGAFSRPQRPSRSALVVRATAATEEKVEAKAEASPEQQTAAPPAPAQKAAPQASAAPSVRRPHSQATKFGERLPTDPLGEAGAGPLPPPPCKPPTLRHATPLNPSARTSASHCRGDGLQRQPARDQQRPPGHGALAARLPPLRRAAANCKPPGLDLQPSGVRCLQH